MKSTTWCYFSPQRRILPKSQWLHWTSLPRAHLSSLLYTKHLWNSFLSRAAVTYLAILLPMNLFPIRCSASGSAGQVSGCGSHTGHTWNAAEPHLFRAAASTAISALLTSGSAEVVYCGLISNNASPGEVWDCTCWGGQGGWGAPRPASTAARGQPPPRRPSTAPSQLTGSPGRAGLGRLHLRCSWSGCCPVACRKEGRGWRLAPSARLGLPRHRGVPPPPRSACSAATLLGAARGCLTALHAPAHWSLSGLSKY